MGVLVGAGDLGFRHQLLDLGVDRREPDAVLLGVDDEPGETQADEDGGPCDGCPPVVCATVNRRLRLCHSGCALTREDRALCGARRGRL